MTHPPVQQRKEGLSPGTIVLILVLVGSIVAGTIMVAILATRRSRVNDVDSAALQNDAALREALAAMTIPDFQLTDQTGATVDRSIFEGHWTVLEFMFSACVTACPVMKGNLFTIQQELGDAPVNFVSITVDPEHDTPEHLAAYSDRFGVADDKWRFLTGDIGTIIAICEEGLGFGVTVDDSLTITRPDGGTMSNIMHPSRFFVISPDVKVVGMYDGLDREDSLRMARDLKRLVRSDSY
ncbi:MAG: SCO family protein [Phycisphaerales bacterium]|nr:SCO family protein [Phycisphaerales bacterium]